MTEKIISGGQTGADQAGLDVAIELGIPHGGWIPKDRKTEEGPLPAKYKLKKMKTTSYPKRTEKNILDSDGTVIFTFGKLTGGSELTRKLAKTHGYPCLHVDLNKASVGEAAELVRPWIEKNKIKVLNVAGSRASKAPKIHDIAKKILKAAIGMDRMQFTECTEDGRLQKFQTYVHKGSEFFEGEGEPWI
jgi:hypothetical protein